jgi:predicted amino acid racemase
VGLVGNIAQFNYKGNHVRSGEINAFSRWVPTDPVFKNLTVWAMVWSWMVIQKQEKHSVLTDGHYTQAHTLASEIIIEYRFNMF